MDANEGNLFWKEAAPILLGYSQRTREIAKRFFGSNRVISHVFCERIPLLHRFSLIMKFHTIHGFSRDELLLIALEDFADSVRNTETVLYLIPTTQKTARFVRRHRDRLETRYMIASESAQLEKL